MQHCGSGGALRRREGGRQSQPDLRDWTLLVYFSGAKLTGTTAPPITHFWVFCPLQRCTSGPCERRFPRQGINFSTPTAEFFKHYSEDAPTKLNVSVNVADTDWQKMKDLFDQEHKWMLAKMREHIREVNGMLVEERRKVQKRYKEYDGCYLGHYAQWFFFTIGFSVVAGGLAVLIAQYFVQ